MRGIAEGLEYGWGIVSFKKHYPDIILTSDKCSLLLISFSDAEQVEEREEVMLGERCGS